MRFLLATIFVLACSVQADAQSAWDKANAALVGAMIERGDIAGAAQAQDFIYHSSRGQAGAPMPYYGPSAPAYPTIPAMTCTTSRAFNSLVTTCR